MDGEILLIGDVQLGQYRHAHGLPLQHCELFGIFPLRNDDRRGEQIGEIAVHARRPRHPIVVNEKAVAVDVRIGREGDAGKELEQGLARFRDADPRLIARLRGCPD